MAHQSPPRAPGYKRRAASKLARGRSSVGRAPPLQGGSRGFDPPRLHQPPGWPHSRSDYARARLAHRTQTSDRLYAGTGARGRRRGIANHLAGEFAEPGRRSGGGTALSQRNIAQASS